MFMLQFALIGEMFLLRLLLKLVKTAKVDFYLRAPHRGLRDRYKNYFLVF